MCLSKKLIGIIAFLLAMPCQALTGSGTETDPYEITSTADLKAISNGTTDYYRLVNDIVDCPCLGINFCGHFDGTGHSISLNVSETNSWIESAGLFHSCSGATIKNLTVKGAISISKSRYYTYGSKKYYNGLGNWWNEYYYLVRLRLGAICGIATATTFKNVRNEASIKGMIAKAKEGYDYYLGSDCGLGGLVGVAQSCVFLQCCNVGSISGYLGSIEDAHSPSNAGLTIIQNGVGALIGTDVNSTITDSYAKSNISCSGYIYCEGALIGNCESSRLSRCYFDGQTNYAPFIGNNNGSIITDCISRVKLASIPIFPSCVNCYTSVVAAIGHEGVEYVEPEMFSIQSWYATKLPSWDFSGVWYMPSGIDAMPLLRTEPSIKWTGFPVYGGNVEFTSTNLSSALIIESTNDNEIVVDGAKITFLKAGNVNVKVSQNADSPFKPVDETITFNVQKAKLTISAKDYTMNYGDHPSSENILDYTGFIGSDTSDSLDRLPTVIFGGSSTSDVGKYNIIVSGATSSNYSISYNKGVQTIEPRSIMVKPIDMTRLYGNPNPQFNLEFEGWVNGHNESKITQYPTASTQATSKSYAGDYVITVRGGEIHPNYRFQYLTGTLTIDKAPLMIGVKDAKRNTFEFNPEFELTFSGFKNGDDSSSIDELPEISCEASYDSPEGIYPIILSGGSDKNYLIKLKNGVLIVEPKSGIEEVCADYFADSSARYFTIGGIEVTPDKENKIKPGIYIKVFNNATSKICIRKY